MIGYILTVVLCVLLWKLLRFGKDLRDRYSRYATVPTMSKNHWFWGFTSQISTLDGLMKACLKDIEETKADWIVTRMTFIFPVVHPVSPSAVKDIAMATNLPKGLGFGSPYSMAIPWIGEGLVVSNGAKWERNRRLLTPAFHFDVLKPYVDITNQVADIFMGKVIEQTSNGQSVDVYPIVGRAALDTMLRCTMSYNDDTVQDADNSHAYMSAVQDIFKLITRRALNPLMLNDFIYSNAANGKKFKKLCDFTHQFIVKIIKARQISLENDPSQLKKRHLDFLDIVISARDEHGVGMTDKEMQDECGTIVFAGHETTASAVSWSIHFMAKYPEFQAKIRAEVEEVLNGRTRLVADDLTKLKFTTCFIKETLRMYPPLPSVGRTLVAPLNINGVTFMPGDKVNITPYLINHNPSVWGDNHMEFQPERFLPENIETRSPFAFASFSAGHRNCIGQHFALNEVKVLITRLAMRFDISADPDKEAIPFMEFGIRSKDGIFIHFKERK